MAAGIGTPWSDFDVRLIVRDDASEEIIQRYTEATFPFVDLGVLTLSEFAAHAAWGSPEAWDRQSFTHARVLLDRPNIIQALVVEKGQLPADQQEPFAIAMLDAFINSVYRALKCRRKHLSLCVGLEASEAVIYALHVLFAWEGRLKPYPVWLEHDLQTAPLTTLPLTSEELLSLIGRIVTHGDIAALQELLAGILDSAEARGYSDVIATWGEDVAWMRSYVAAP